MSVKTSILLSAVLFAVPAAVSAQAQQPATTPDAATSQKMKDECESRKGDAAAASAASEMKVASGNADAATATPPTAPASAETDQTAREANKDIVENTRTAPDGSKVVATGPAKPVENWFGCPPEKTPEAAKK